MILYDSIIVFTVKNKRFYNFFAVKILNFTIGNRVYPKRVSRVQIPPSPPKPRFYYKTGVFF